MTDLDTQVRAATFEFLDRERQKRGDDVFSYSFLSQGFEYLGQQVTLIGMRGIWKPAILPDMPISIRTAFEGRYADTVDDYSGRLRYHYENTDPDFFSNRSLRLARQRNAPLIYLFGVAEGRYMATWPAYVVGEDPEEHEFIVELDNKSRMLTYGAPPTDMDAEATRRHYVTTTVQQRLHQRSFRERVLHAYRQQCALCRLRHSELLEAAHILPDKHPQGAPVVTNGIALCQLHHAAYDRHVLGIRQDCVVEIRMDILEEEDGPMLKWGLQHFQGASLHLPRRQEWRPNPEFLAEHYRLFKSAR